VLFEDALHQADALRKICAWFDRQKVPFEIISINATGPQLTPLSDCPQLQAATGIDAAIRFSKYPSLLFVDSNYDFNSKQYELLVQDSGRVPFQSSSYRHCRPPRSRRIMVWLFLIILRLTLKVRKTRINPGMVLIEKSKLKELNLTHVDHQSPDSIGQILALAKRSQFPVNEHVCVEPQPDTQWTKANSSDPHFPKSRSLKRSIFRGIAFWFNALAFPASSDLVTKKSSRVHEAAYSTLSKFVASTLLLLIASFLLLSNSSYPLLEPDETRNAQLALNIIESGNWFSLSLNDQPYWDKPPLLAWLTAASYRMFGLSEFATRLPSAIASLAMMAVMLLLGRRLIGFRAAWLGVAATMLGWGFLFQCRYVTMDAILTCCVTIAFLCVLYGVGSNGKRRSWSVVLAGVMAGFGVLAKGPVCIVILAVPVLAWLLLHRFRTKKLTRRTLKRFCLPMILVSLPWFVVTAISTPAFLLHFFWKHHVVRFSEAFNHQEPFWYYLPVLWLFMFPASILIPRVIKFLASSKPEVRLTRTPEHGVLAISAGWIIVFFSLSDCKLPAYILPAFPMIGMLIGVVLDQMLVRRGHANGALHFSSVAVRNRIDRLPKRIAIGMAVLTLAVSGVVIFRYDDFQLPFLLGLFFAALVAGMLMIAVRRSTPRGVAWLATGLICVVFVSTGINQLVPSIATERSILSTLAAKGDDDNFRSLPVVYFGRDSFAAKMYLPGREVVHVREENLPDMQKFLRQHPASAIVATSENVQRIVESGNVDVEIESIGTRHLFQSRPATSQIARAKEDAQVR
jgi:4-amino-4-deoxy-L-arabinose transferase-like glycosyltransferase